MPILQDLSSLHQVADEKPLPHGFAVGISHYHREKGKSYIQVHDDMVHESHEDAVAAVHARIDLHAGPGFEHGKYDPVALNPNEQYSHDLVRQNAEYHASPYAWGTLPKIDAITGETLGDDIYVPHVDNCRLGHCYQAILQEMNGGHGSLEQYNLGCATLENAIACAHAIVDEILVPYALNKEAAKGE